jgi:hypothetical protein
MPALLGLAHPGQAPREPAARAARGELQAVEPRAEQRGVLLAGAAGGRVHRIARPLVPARLVASARAVARRLAPRGVAVDSGLVLRAQPRVRAALERSAAQHGQEALVRPSGHLAREAPGRPAARNVMAARRGPAARSARAVRSEATIAGLAPALEVLGVAEGRKAPAPGARGRGRSRDPTEGVGPQPAPAAAEALRSAAAPVRRRSSAQAGAAWLGEVPPRCVVAMTVAAVRTARAPWSSSRGHGSRNAGSATRSPAPLTQLPGPAEVGLPASWRRRHHAGRKPEGGDGFPGRSMTSCVLQRAQLGRPALLIVWQRPLGCTSVTASTTLAGS